MFKITELSKGVRCVSGFSIPVVDFRRLGSPSPLACCFVGSCVRVCSRSILDAAQKSSERVLSLLDDLTFHPAAELFLSSFAKLQMRSVHGVKLSHEGEFWK